MHTGINRSKNAVSPPRRTAWSAGVALAACLAAQPALALDTSKAAMAKKISNGDPIPKGWIVVRDGNVKDKQNYAKEDLDQNKKLRGVSALCAENNADVAKLVKSDKTRKWGNPNQASVTTIVNLGGGVRKDEQPKNPSHCLISGLTVGQMIGVW
ncbi:hypothetical protein [Luteimonas aquatica]|uniref:hypothetical protein n=1 Tax=Luteimonas aquatica TaxID=450364 RepID=UPI001F5A9454|nr:hypothetical protein [Luteimonas aquatica]